MSELDEQLAKASGFDSAQEMFRLIASVDLRATGAMSAFQDWKEYDGSKVGLLKLIESQNASAPDAPRP